MDEESIETERDELPKGVDKVYVGIGVTTFFAGFIAIIVIFSLIYADYYKNPSVESTTNSVKKITVENSTYKDNYVEITGYHAITTDSKNVTFYVFNANVSSIRFTETVQCDVLLVSGGGGGAAGGGGLSGNSGTGGGGGGGVGEGILTFYKEEIYHISVGKGGVSGHHSLGTNGQDSTIRGKNINEIAYGGGFGGYYIFKGNTGGSSGGNYGFSGLLKDPATNYIFDFNNIKPNMALRGNGVLTYYGNQGGYGLNNTNLNSGSGGGGAGGNGEGIHKDGSGGNGGDGFLWKKNNKYYGAGGGGGGCRGCRGGKGGKGGGGDGSSFDQTQPGTTKGGAEAKPPSEQSGSDQGATHPEPYTGGGGGGGASAGSGFSTGGAGGIVIIIPNYKFSGR